MFKYRLLPGRKIPGKNCFRVYGKTIVVYGIIINIIILFVFWLKMKNLSNLRDIGESRAELLNDELKRLPIIEESADSWKVPQVEGGRILSAYLDTRPEVVLEEDSSLTQEDSAWAMIRIMSIIPVKMENSPLTCHYRYRYKDSNEMYTLSKRSIGTRLAAFQENFGMFYCAAFVLCELPGRENADRINLPYKVSISSDTKIDGNKIKESEFVVVRYPKNGWKILSRETRNDQGEIDKNVEKNIDKNVEKNIDKNVEKNSIAVCVQPMHHQFDKALDLIAFVEFYRTMGINRFTFYRDTVSPEVDKILEYYAHAGVATVIDWPLSKIYIFERNLRVDGIFAALNECMYRSSFHDNYTYVAGVDIDEYIVPRKHDNITSMMDYLNGQTGVDEQTGAWIFRNMFFYLMHPDDTSTLEPGLPKLKVHTKTMRWTEINWPGDRSKFIVKSHDILDMGNHHIWKLKRTWSTLDRRYKEVVVDPEIAGSHHYRRCETTVETCWLRQTVVDKTAHRFTPTVARRVADISKKIFPSTPLWI